MPKLEERVRQLLGNLGKSIEQTKLGQSFGYSDIRKMYGNPTKEGEQVIRVVDTDPYGDTASPDAKEEVLMQMTEVLISATELAAGDPVKTQALAKLFEDLSGQLEQQRANLFESSSSKQNEAFNKQLKKNAKKLAEFIDVAVAIVGSSREALDARGHNRRSKSSPTIVLEFTTSENKPGETQFVIYEPAGRLTKNQMEVLGLDPKAAHPYHATTSHQKSGLVQGNSSFVRMIVGTKHSDGSINIVNDSFSGPGARMPYEDLKGADKYKRMAVKATTFLNQEEIIQALAQRIYDKHLVGKSNEEIQVFFKENPLSETYMQVITPSQGYIPFDGDQNFAQFEFVREAIQAFDDAEDLALQVDTNHGVVDVNARYRGHHAAFGVNIPGMVLPQWIEGVQNQRFMNEMFNETVQSLPESVFEKDSEGDIAFQGLKQAFKGLDPDNQQFETGTETTPLVANKVLYKMDAELLASTKAKYRTAMVEYMKAYRAGDKDLQDKLDAIQSFEEIIQVQEAKIDAVAKTRHTNITNAFNSDGEKNISNALKEFKRVAQAQIKGPDCTQEEKAQIQSMYNRCAYLYEAQKLYFNNSWAQAEHNFELQTLMSSLATELDHGNTKGCKSNNDRGQRLAQKIAGNALVTSKSDSGLFDGTYFEDKHVLEKAPKGRTLSEQIDTKLPTIQAIHHTHNTAVSGGKFGFRNEPGFADNQMLGKAAKLAKLKSIGKKEPLYKNLKFWAAVAVAIGVVAAVATVVPAIAIGTALTATALVTGTVTLGSAIKEKFDEYRAKAKVKQKSSDYISKAEEHLDSVVAQTNKSEREFELDMSRSSTKSVVSGLGGKKESPSSNITHATKATSELVGTSVSLDKTPDSGTQDQQKDYAHRDSPSFR